MALRSNDKTQKVFNVKMTMKQVGVLTRKNKNIDVKARDLGIYGEDDTKWKASDSSLHFTRISEQPWWRRLTSSTVTIRTACHPIRDETFQINMLV